MRSVGRILSTVSALRSVCMVLSIGLDTVVYGEDVVDSLGTVVCGYDVVDRS